MFNKSDKIEYIKYLIDSCLKFNIYINVQLLFENLNDSNLLKGVNINTIEIKNNSIAGTLENEFIKALITIPDIFINKIIYEATNGGALKKQIGIVYKQKAYKPFLCRKTNRVCVYVNRKKIFIKYPFKIKIMSF